MELKLVNLTKKYGDISVLNHVNLIMTPGVYGLCGPNGSGKSTLMNLITGNQQACEGKIFFESEDKFVDGTYQSDENLLNNISTLNKHGA